MTTLRMAATLRRRLRRKQGRLDNWAEDVATVARAWCRSMPQFYGGPLQLQPTHHHHHTHVYGPLSTQPTKTCALGMPAQPPTGIIC